jgi:hypothetical protein
MKASSRSVKTGTTLAALAVWALAAVTAAPALAWDGCGCGSGRHVHHPAQRQDDSDQGGDDAYSAYPWPTYPRTWTTCTAYGCYQVRCDMYRGCVQGPWHWRH